MFSCINNMESEDEDRKKTVRNLTKFYVERMSEPSKLDGGDLLRNQITNIDDAGSDLTPRNEEFPYSDGNATISRVSFVTKTIKVDSHSELMMLTRNHAVRNLISNASTSTKVQPLKVPSSKSNRSQIRESSENPGTSDDSNRGDFDPREGIYTEVMCTTVEERGSSEYDHILGFNVSKEILDEVPSNQSYLKPHVYDVIIRRDTSAEIPVPPNTLKTREKDHHDAIFEKNNSTENLVMLRDADKRNSASLLTTKFPPSQESPYDVVLKTESPRGSPNPLSEKLIAQIEEKLKVEKSRLISSGVYSDKITKAQSLIIQELIEAEQRYLEKLKYVIDNYLTYFRSVQISARIELVFGNIEKLYEEVNKLFAELKQYNSIDDIASAFVNNVKVFDQYAVFSANKSTANQWFTRIFGQLIKDRERELQDNNTFESYFTDSMQKPGRYLTFLINLQAETRKNHQLTEKLDEAVALVEKKIKEMNTKLAVDCIRCCPIDLCKMGSFIMKGIFMTNLNEETVIFLFEEHIVFCVHDKEDSDRYNYINHIATSQVSLRHSERPTAFKLSFPDKSKLPSARNQYEIHIEASTKEIKQTWFKEIEKLLRSPSLDSDEEYDELLRRYDEIKFPGILPDKSSGPRKEYPGRDNMKSEYVEILDLLPEQASLLKELTKTEESYLKGLKKFIDDFYTYPESISSYKYLLVNNIEDIYNESEKLYTRLLECNGTETIAKAFFESEGVFDACAAYMRNKSAYDFVYTELKKVQ
ncbi:hypothetical protein AMK59_7390, partial [Oryctes borbonicus]